MDIFKLTTSDVMDIEMLINITKSITNTYNELTNLEINSKNNTIDYKENLTMLNSYINIENNIYKRLFVDINKTFASYLYINKTYNLNELQITDLILNKPNNYYLYRISNTLRSRIETTPYLKYIMEDANILNDLGEFNSLIYFNSMQLNNNDILPLIKKDITNLYLSYIDSESKKDKNKVILSDLITSKYEICFLNKNIETNILKNNFNINNEVYIEHIYKGESLSFEEMTDSIKVYYIINNIIPLVANIVETDNISLVNPNVYKELLLTDTLLKSSIQLLSFEDVKAIKSIFDEVEKIMKPYCNKSLEMLHEVFDNYDKDKERLRILKLRVN